MESYKDFAEVLQDFFYVYLVKERGASGNTIRSYRDTFVHLIDYLKDVHNVNAEKVSLSIMTKDKILNYLDWLESNKSSSVSTRNQRYAALRSFFNYMMYIDPTHMYQWKSVCSIRIKQTTHETLSYLTIEGMKCLLEQIDTHTPIGRRNLAMLSLLYNTGARVQELINLTPSSIRRSKPYVIELFGKGSKKRLVPLDEDIMRLLEAYMEENKLNLPGREHHPLFYNAWDGKLTDPGITYIIKKYAVMARMLHPEHIPERISPHVFRHTRAMHLLQAGVNIVYIRDILGHVSIQTTEVYARADSKLKREALEKAYTDIGITEPEIKSWEKSPKLKEFLKSLG